MGRLIARTLTVALVLGAVALAVTGRFYLAFLAVFIAAAAPIGRWIARSDAAGRAAGSDHQTPPAGLGPGGWGGGGV